MKFNNFVTTLLIFAFSAFGQVGEITTRWQLPGLAISWDKSPSPDVKDYEFRWGMKYAGDDSLIYSDETDSSETEVWRIKPIILDSSIIVHRNAVEDISGYRLNIGIVVDSLLYDKVKYGGYQLFISVTAIDSFGNVSTPTDTLTYTQYYFADFNHDGKVDLLDDYIYQKIYSKLTFSHKFHKQSIQRPPPDFHLYWKR